MGGWIFIAMPLKPLAICGILGYAGELTATNNNVHDNQVGIYAESYDPNYALPDLVVLTKNNVHHNEIGVSTDDDFPDNHLHQNVFPTEK